MAKKSARKVLAKARKGKARKSLSVKPLAVKPWTNAQIEEAFRRFQAANPEPKGELEHINPFTLLVAVVLSAQATDAGVNKATPALFALADTPEKMIALGEERVRELIKTIGLFRTKAKNVVELSRRLVAKHGGAGAARARSAGGAARRRAQDRQRGAQHRVSASRPSRSTRIFSASATAPAWRRAKIRSKSSRNSSGRCRRSTNCTRTIG